MGNLVLSREQMEARRLRAIPDIIAGKTTRKIGKEHGVSSNTASQWIRAYKAGGEEALKRRISSGKPYRLSEEERREIGDMIRANPEIKAREIRAFIKEKYGVSYNKDHVYAMLRKRVFNQDT